MSLEAYPRRGGLAGRSGNDTGGRETSRMASLMGSDEDVKGMAGSLNMIEGQDEEMKRKRSRGGGVANYLFIVFFLERQWTVDLLRAYSVEFLYSFLSFFFIYTHSSSSPFSYNKLISYILERYAGDDVGFEAF
ncbi:hypothetical protein QN277_016502 [Acacia crassicarpa]|uniref:Uncharacterized protein n=1 Tax=Acacia crassicarpa TaxID=499986 RepID=A0AAE1TC67_9FABA|nr:hypothetical protein QN277_016502 [Acacia crassicarpa]